MQWKGVLMILRDAKVCRIIVPVIGFLLLLELELKLTHLKFFPLSETRLIHLKDDGHLLNDQLAVLIVIQTLPWILLESSKVDKNVSVNDFN